MSKAIPPRAPPVDTPAPTKVTLPVFLFNAEPKSVPVGESGEGTERVVRPGGVKGNVEGSAGRKPHTNPPVIAWLREKVAGISMLFGKEGLYVPVAWPPERIIVMVSVQVLPSTLKVTGKDAPGKLRVTLSRLGPKKVSVRSTDMTKGPGARESPVVMTAVPGSVQVRGGGGGSTPMHRSSSASFSAIRRVRALMRPARLAFWEVGATCNSA
jgi:hypothetical protein